MKWREIGSYLRELWHRPAGPMNWKNPIRVFAVLGWLVVQVFVLLGWAGWRVFQGLMLLGWTVFRVVQFVLALPALVLFFSPVCGMPCGALYGVPSRRLMSTRSLLWCNTTPPISSTAMVLWYYLSPFVAVMLCGVISVTVWKVWLEGRRRDFAPFAKLPPWPLDPKQKAPAIVIGEVHHPVEAREIFSPSWLTIPERGLYTGVAIFGAVGSGKTSACMNPFARQLLGWQAGNPKLRAAALVLEVKGDFCHDIHQILVEAGRGQDYIENARWGQGKRVQDRVSRPTGRHRRQEMNAQQEQREAIPAGRDGWGGPDRERVAWQRAEERTHWARYQRRRGKALGELEGRSKREWSALYGRHQRQREYLVKDCRGVLGRFRAELEDRLRWERVLLGKAHFEAVRGIEREAGAAYRDGMEGSQERAELAARTGGMYAHYDPPIDGSALRRSVMQERIEQMREIDGEQAYEKMRLAVEKANQRLAAAQFPSRDRPERSGPERGGPERDFGPSR